MKVPITGNAELDALTVRTAIKLRGAALRAQARAQAAAAQARAARHRLQQRYRRTRRRLADSKAGQWLKGVRNG